MRMMSGSLGPATVAVLFLVSAVYGQDTVPAPPAPSEMAPADAPATAEPAPASTGGAPAPAAGAELGKPADLHALLDDLSGGPEGSPTAQRSNPQPGTSTSIPTTNPATVRRVEQERPGNENMAVEDTGIEGQCDPVVSIGCPAIADRLQPKTTAGADAGTTSQPASAAQNSPTGATNAEGAAQPRTGQAAPEKLDGSGN